MVAETEGGRRFRGLYLALGPVLGLAAMALPQLFPASGLSDAAGRVLLVTVWTTVWWVTEPIPIPVSSLLPAVLLPVLGIESAKNAAGHYANDLILLLLGGFFIARSIEVWGLHRRMALTVLGWLGESPRQLVFGFVLAAAALSMWISNTATTVMLIPIALAVAGRVQGEQGAGQSNALTMCLLLGIAYGANVGGTGTLIGTPPNLIFAQNLVTEPAVSPSIDFLTWLLFGVPVVVIFAPLIAWLLGRVLIPLPAGSGNNQGRDVIRAEKAELGRLGVAEGRVLFVFVLAGLLWTFKGNREVPGWSWLFVGEGPYAIEHLHGYLTDSLVALAMALLLFVLPSGEGRGRPLLTWKDVETVPWGMLLLFGGGFAIASGFQSSGLSDWVGARIVEWLELPTWALVSGVSLAVSFTTELTSNTASTQLLMPILKGAALGAGLHPLVLMLPAIISVSFAFMLPVATAPNALVFATGRVPIRVMVRCGFWLNLIGVLVVMVVVYGFALRVLGVL